MSIREIRILSEAADDLDLGRAFYEAQEPRLGAYFWDSLLADIESLVVHAGVHNRVEGYHRLLAKRFPYAVYYQLGANVVDVIAILPLRRDPKWLAGFCTREAHDTHQARVGRNAIAVPPSPRQ